MKKRIFSVLLVVAMLAGMIVMPAYAEADEEVTSNMEQICPCCDKAFSEITNWQPLDLAAAAPTADGHYYLEKAVNRTSVATIMYNVTIDLRGQEYTCTKRLFGVESGATLTLIDSVGGATLSSSTGSNGSINVFPGGTLNLYGGTYKTTGEQDYGGVLYVKGTVNVYAPTKILGGKAIEGGAAFLADADGILNVFGGTIEDGTATENGDGIYVKAGQVYLKGGKVGSVLPADEEGIVSVEGNAVVENFDSSMGGLLTVGALTEGASIRVSGEANKEFTTRFASEGAAQAAAQYMTGFYADINVTGTNLALGEQKCPHCGVAMSGIVWEEWNFKTGTKASLDGSTSRFLVTGHYYLSDNLELPGQYWLGISDNDRTLIQDGTLVPFDVCLDTRGYDISSTSRLIYAYPGHKFAMINTVGTGSAFTTTGSSTGTCLYMSRDTEAQIYDVDIINKNTKSSTKASTAAGNILLNTDATLKMAYCTIDGIVANRGSAIYANSAKSVELTNCVIKGEGTKAPDSGTAYNYGGAICTLTVDEVTLTNCTVIGGETKNGGAIYTTSPITLKNCEVYGGSATNYGGNIYIDGAEDNKIVVTLDGTTVKGGIANERAGNIYATDFAELVVTGNAQILDGYTDGNGGNFYVTNDAILDVSGNAVISGGWACNGGAIYTTSPITLKNCEVYGGSATNYGGNIYIDGPEDNKIVVTLDGTTVKGGIANERAGNIYATHFAELVVTGNAQILDGYTDGNGGNFYVTNDAILDVRGNAVISGGRACNGGNGYIPTRAVLKMSGGTVKDGVAYNDGETENYGRGGNFYLGAAEHTISGGTISGGITEADDPTTEFGGGNLYLHGNGKLTISGGTISDGSTGTNGGNIFALGDLILENATISGGSADNSGADIYIGDSDGSVSISDAITGNLGMGFSDEHFVNGVPYGSEILHTTATTLNAYLILDGAHGNAPIIAKDGALWVQDGGVAILDLEGNYEYFADAADAVEDFNINTDAWLVICGADEIDDVDGLWIDVNGCDVTLSGEGTVSCFDSANADYETYGLVTLDGVSLNNTIQTNVDGIDYYTINESGVYSFHVLDMEITAVGLKTASGGLYYYAKYYCDDKLAENVDTFGIVTQLNEMPTDLTSDSILYSEISGKNFVAKREITGATMNNIVSTTEIPGYTNNQRGEMKVYAAPYVILKTGAEKIATEEVGRSLKDCCDAVDTMITDLLAADAEDAVAANYIAYMTNLFNNVWKDMDLTWEFVNFPADEA